MKYVLANGRRYCIDGRLPPAPGVAPAMRFGRYLLASAPIATPPAVHWNRRNPLAIADGLGNDQVGDCAYAGILHLWDIWQGTAAATKADAFSLYKRIRPDFDLDRAVAGDPASDPGGSLPQVLSYARANGLFPDGRGKVAGWVGVDPGNVAHVKAAAWLFGGLYGGASMPDAWAQNPPASDGFVWDLAGPPNPDNGHCIALGGYNATGVVAMTWGRVGIITWRALAEYFAGIRGGELWAPLAADWIDRASAKAPSGFDIVALQADLARIAN